MSLHPFERAGLGIAPFKCTGVRENWFVPAGFPEARKPGGCCNYCGTGILYEYSIESADGKTFVVGSDCVKRTESEVVGFKEARLKLARDKREAKRKESIAERQSRWEKRRTENRDAFNAMYPDIVQFLNDLPEDTYGFLGTMRSNFSYWGGLTERQAEALNKIIQSKAKQKRDAELSRYIATIGTRIDDTFEIILTRSWESDFGWPKKIVHFTLMRRGLDECTYTGNHIGNQGDKISAKFTVAEHTISKYNGAQQTKLSRPMVR